MKEQTYFPDRHFNQIITNLAIKRIQGDDRVKSANYELYSSNLGALLILVVNIELLASGELKSYDGRKGMAVSDNISDFPMIVETSNAELTLILNVGVDFFMENNTFFDHGEQFTQGNPIATDPAGKGVRFWGEAYLEPGIAGIIELGKSNIYAYGTLSGLLLYPEKV